MIIFLRRREPVHRSSRLRGSPRRKRPQKASATRCGYGPFCAVPWACASTESGHSRGLISLIRPTTRLSFWLEVTNSPPASSSGRYPSSSLCGGNVSVRTRTPGPHARPSATALARLSTSRRQPRPATTFCTQVSCPRSASQCRFWLNGPHSTRWATTPGRWTASPGGGSRGHTGGPRAARRHSRRSPDIPCL